MKYVLTLFALLPLQFLFAQSKSLTLDDWKKMVVYLQRESPSFEMKSGERVEVWYKNPSTNGMERKIIKGNGTGFLIMHNGREYLVTAKHVADMLDSTSTILLNVSKDSSISITFASLHQQSLIPNARWFKHPLADIALHPIFAETKLDLISLGTSIIPKSDKHIQLLTDVIILGFPLGLGVNKVSSPIAKKVEIGSDITTVDLPVVNPKLRFYLLDQDVAQGYSGSPVFCTEDIPSGMYVGDSPVLVADKKMTLIGVISFGLSDVSGGKISFVVPISYMWEIFDSNEFREYESHLPK